MYFKYDLYRKISWTHLIAYVGNRKIPMIFFICKSYSNAGISCSTSYLLWWSYPLLIYIHFFGDKSNKVMIQTAIFSASHNVINMSHRFTWIINLSYNLVYLFETIHLHQLCDKQQSYCICYYMNIIYLYYI